MIYTYNIYDANSIIKAYHVTLTLSDTQSQYVWATRMCVDGCIYIELKKVAGNLG